MKQWFVMRDLRRANAKETAYKLLMKKGVEAFCPMTLEKNKRTGKKELVPVLHWLLFVHGTKEEIDTLITPTQPAIPYLQYNYERGKSAKYGGMVVDDKAMHYFRIALTKQNFPLVYHYNDITPAMKGRKVLVVRGELAGYKGYIQKFTGGRNMRLFVELEHFCLAPVQISPEEVVFIDENDNKLSLSSKTNSPEKEQRHYSQLSQITDLINTLRFSIPQDPKLMTDKQLEEAYTLCQQADTLFTRHNISDYLPTDDFCKDKLRAIEAELAIRRQA